MPRIIPFLSLAFLLAGLVSAQDAPAPPPLSPESARLGRAAEAGGQGEIEITARWPYGYARSVAFAGSTPVAMLGSVFQTLDLSTPGEIGVLGELVLPGVVSDMAAEGDLVAVMTTHYSDAETGLFVVDVSDPATPALRGKLTGIGATGITVRDGVAYVGTFETTNGPQVSLRIVSLADPDDPAEVGVVETQGRPSDITLNGTRAYLAMGQDGISVVDVSDPAAPVVTGIPITETTGAVGVGEVGGQPILAAVVDDAAGNDQLRLYSLADPDVPTLLGEDALRTDLFFGPIEMDLVWTSGERIVVGAGYGGLQFADAADPANPNVRVRRRTSVANVADGTSRLATDGTTILAADVFSGLHTANADARDLTAYRPAPNIALDVMEDVGVVYVAHGTYGVVQLARLILVEPGAARGDGFEFVGRAHGPGWNYTSDLAQTATHVYAADGYGGVQVVEKATLQTVASVLASATAPVRRVAVTSDGSLLLAGIGNADDPLLTSDRVVHLFSLADPANPVEVGSFTPPVGVGDLDGTGPEVWVADLFGSRLRVYDTSDPASPMPLGDVTMTGSDFRLARDFDRLYSLVTASVANVLDVSAPAAPTVLGTVQSAIGYVGLDASGDRLAMAGAGVGVYRTTNLASPVLLAYSDAFGDVLMDVSFLDATDDVRLALAAGHAGVYTVALVPDVACECGPPSRGVEVRVAPNPSSGPVTVEVLAGEPAVVDVEVLDVLGRRVCQIAQGVRVAERVVLEWGGRDDAGVPLPAGVYLVRLSAEAGGATQAVTVVR